MLDGKLFGLLATLISKLRVVLSRVLAIGTALCCIEAMVILTKGGRHSSPPDWNNQKGYLPKKDERNEGTTRIAIGNRIE
jgi:hypothetical protein